MTTPEDQREANVCPCGHRVSAGWYLCERCSGKLNEALSEIADRYRHLTARTGYEPGRYDKAGGGKPGTKPPGRVDVMAVRDFRSGQTEPTTWRGADGKFHQESEHDTPAVLRAVLGWCETVGGERGFTTEPWLPSPPTFRGPRWGVQRFTMTDHDEMTGYIDWDSADRFWRAFLEEAHRRQRATFAPRELVEHATTWLARQDDWIARWPHGGDLADRARQLRNRLRRLTGEPNPRPSAFCVALLEDRTECTAPIWIPDAAPDGAAYLPVVRCTTKRGRRHEYSRTDLLRLALANDNQRGARRA